MKTKTYPSVVRVYRNLNRNCWSVLDFDPKSENYNRVIDHVTELSLEEVTLVVQKAGREKVLKEKRKNVHAFVQGSPTLKVELESGSYPDSLSKVVSYDPYKAGQFIVEKEHCGAEEAFVYKADLIRMSIKLCPESFNRKVNVYTTAWWADLNSYMNGTSQILEITEKAG